MNYAEEYLDFYLDDVWGCVNLQTKEVYISIKSYSKIVGIDESVLARRKYVLDDCLIPEHAAVRWFSRDEKKFIEQMRNIGFAAVPSKAKTISSFFRKAKNRLKKIEEQTDSRKEAFWQARLARKLNGKMEVDTPSGRADIVTTKEVIEVKFMRHWKSAIGQALVYCSHFPGKTPRVHLIGNVTEKTKAKIKAAAAKQRVIVTFQCETTTKEQSGCVSVSEQLSLFGAA